MIQNKLYAQQIKEALDFIKNSKNAVNEHYAKEQNTKVNYDQTRLKQKGSKKLMKS